MSFYSYLWLREDTTPYYVGKGSGNRAFRRFGHRVRPPKDRSRILIFPHATEAEAFESEMAFIKWFGRKDLGTGYLRNLTDGGENPPSARGKKRSEETLQKMRAAQKGHPGNWGSTRSAETKEKMSRAQMGRTKGQPWTLARRRAGQPHRTAEEKAHLSEAMKKIRASRTWSSRPVLVATT
jgi:NUMOD3 motif-containing protein